MVCTFTNTRDQGSIELKKIWVAARVARRRSTSAPAPVATQTDSQETGATGTGPLTTGANDVNTGTYYVSESGGLATDYTQTLRLHRGSAPRTRPGTLGNVPDANDSVVGRQGRHGGLHLHQHP